MKAIARSSTEILVTWEEVPAIDENGIIINYETQFEPLEFTDVLMTGAIIAANLSAMITGLQEYVEYSISVRAYTSVGPGPYSDLVTQRTLEDCKLIHCQIIIHEVSLWPKFLTCSNYSFPTCT